MYWYSGWITNTELVSLLAGDVPFEQIFGYIDLTSFYFEWMWTFEAPTQPKKPNDSSIDASWCVDLGKT